MLLKKRLVVILKRITTDMENIEYKVVGYLRFSKSSFGANIIY